MSALQAVDGTTTTKMSNELLQFAEVRTLPKPLGDTGLVRFGGILADEPIGAITGIRWYRIVREMLYSPVIRGMLFAIEMPIRRAEWHMDPAEEEDAELTPIEKQKGLVTKKTAGKEAQEVADFIDSCRKDMFESWEDTLASIMSFLPYGFSLFETVYKRRLGPTGDTPSQYNDGRIGWDDWSPRLQETIIGWGFDDRGRIEHVNQQGPNQTHVIPIPMTRLLHFKTGGYRNSPQGESVLRAAFNDWDAVAKIQQIEAIGIERDLAGLPVAFIPSRYMRSDDAGRSAEEKSVFSAVKKMVTNVRQNDEAGIVFPMDYDVASGKPLFDFKLLNSGGTRQFDTGAVITRRLSQMSMTVLADFLMLGHQSSGSYALSQDKTRLFTTAIQAYLDMLGNTITDQAIRRLVLMNPDIDPRLCPRLRPGSPDETDLAAIGSFFQALWPAIQSILDAKDQVNILAHLFDEADWPAPKTDPEARQLLQDQGRENDAQMSKIAMEQAAQGPPEPGKPGAAKPVVVVPTKE